jgi:protein SCO1/2
MLQAARAVDRAGLAGKVEFVSLTIDPTRDDRRHVAAYRRTFGAPGNWETATGDPRAVNRLWDRLGVWRRRVHVAAPYPRDWLTGAPLTTDIQHTDDLIFIDARQRFRFEMDGSAAVRGATMPARIARFMDALGRRNLARPSPHSWSGRDVERVLHWLIDEQGAA